MGEKQVDEHTKKIQNRWKNGKAAVNIMRRGQSGKPKKAEKHLKVFDDKERKRTM